MLNAGSLPRECVRVLYTRVYTLCKHNVSGHLVIILLCVNVNSMEVLIILLWMNITGENTSSALSLTLFQTWLVLQFWWINISIILIDWIKTWTLFFCIPTLLIYDEFLFYSVVIIYCVWWDVFTFCLWQMNLCNNYLIFGLCCYYVSVRGALPFSCEMSTMWILKLFGRVRDAI